MDIDPIEFGKLQAEVGALNREVGELKADVRELLELANKGRGGLWMFNSGLVLAGGVAAWVFEHVLKR
jgi:hypothetical protein